METTTSTARLGVDIGRVLIDGSSHPGGGDTAFFQGDTATYLATPEMAGAFEAVARLAALVDGRVWLVSKCGARVEGRTRDWLAHHRFAERTGVDQGNLRFCRRRPDKARHCAELGITHFVDDRPDVLTHLDGIVGHRFLFGPQTSAPPAGTVPVADWVRAEAALRAAGLSRAGSPRADRASARR
jgi:hypothetical protein